MGQSSINGPFPMAMLNYQRVEDLNFEKPNFWSLCRVFILEGDTHPFANSNHRMILDGGYFAPRWDGSYETIETWPRFVALRLWPVASRSHTQRIGCTKCLGVTTPGAERRRRKKFAGRDEMRRMTSKLVETAGTLIMFFLSLNLTYNILSHTFTQPFVFCLPLLALAFLQPSLWWNCPTEPALPSLQSMGSSWTLCPSGGAVAYKWTQLSGDTVRESLVRRLPPQLAEGLQKFLVVEPLRTGCWEPQIDWDSNFYILLCQGTSTALALINKSLIAS